jgi:hypothetical protein
MTRKRKHISTATKLATALLALGDIPYEDAKSMTTRQIITFYSFDHYPILHAHGGPDEPWNLRPMLRAEHREKSRSDTSTVAKVKRLASQEASSRARNMTPIRFDDEEAVGQRPESEGMPRTSYRSMRLKRKIMNRPFPKTKRKFVRLKAR